MPVPLRGTRRPLTDAFGVLTTDAQMPVPFGHPAFPRVPTGHREKGTGKRALSYGLTGGQQKKKASLRGGEVQEARGRCPSNSLGSKGPEGTKKVYGAVFIC
uniref:Uncharacterized protein n=1 Tax=Chlamydomonas leiostraca TaxID=1034604 RepID=A0A1L2M557_9CHLO|nr:hypothetical protein [Chlamydomonas leiostraca]APD80599.1 hypothetical protein [Chlamydomonas leiostraca]